MARRMGVLIVLLMLPNAAFGQQVIDLDAEREDVRILGAGEGDRLGFDVYAGDINGDGIADLILGAVGGTPTEGRDGAGTVHVFYGGKPYPKVIDLAETPGDVVIYGAEGGFKATYGGLGDGLGQSCWSADLNGDGIGDLLLGAPNAKSKSGTPAAGKVYVIYGKREGLPAVIDLSETPADVEILGEDSMAHTGEEAIGGALGTVVRTGDFNGDGTQDLILGARLADAQFRMQAGKTYVFYGGPDLPQVIDLDWTVPDVLMWGDLTLDHFGYWLRASDINGDGIDDVVCGLMDGLRTPTGRPGKIFGFYGRRDFPPFHLINLHITDADVMIMGMKSYDLTGFSVNAGDINGDGIGDILADAQGADPEGRTNAGEMHVFYGRNDFPSFLSLSDTPGDLTIYGKAPDDKLSYSSAVGDVTGDGVGDLILGAVTASPGERGRRQWAGEVYVIYGGDDLPKLLDLKKTPPDLRIMGDDAGDQAGFLVYAADLNGDGIDDLLIGARRADPKGRDKAGEVYVIYGGKVDAASYNSAGNEFARLKRYEEAARRYRRAIRQDPSYKEAHYNLGLAYHRLEKFDEAVDAYRQAAKLDRSYAEAHNNLGAAYDDKGDIKKAIKAYRKAIDIRPDYTEAHYNLAGVYVRQGKRDRAISELEETLAFAPDHIEARYRLGTLYEEAGRREEAVEAWKKCIELKPSDRWSSRARRTLRELEGPKR